MMEQFNTKVKELSAKYEEAEFLEKVAPKITQIVERYLGKGKKVNQCTRDQVEQLSLIIVELNDL